MSRLPRVTVREVMAALRRAGFVPDHTRGSHHYWRRSDRHLTPCSSNA